MALLIENARLTNTGQVETRGAVNTSWKMALASVVGPSRKFFDGVKMKCELQRVSSGRVG
jgi:hypothetical protein